MLQIELKLDHGKVFFISDKTFHSAYELCNKIVLMFCLTFIILFWIQVTDFYSAIFTEFNSKLDWLKDYRNITEICCNKYFFHHINITI